MFKEYCNLSITKSIFLPTFPSLSACDEKPKEENILKNGFPLGEISLNLTFPYEKLTKNIFLMIYHINGYV